MIKERLAKLNNNYARKAPKAKTNLIQSYERIPNQKHGEKTPLEIIHDQEVYHTKTPTYSKSVHIFLQYFS